VSARQAALNRWTATGRTSVEKEKRFLEGQSSTQSNAFRFAPGTPELWHSRGQEFPVYLFISPILCFFDATISGELKIV